MTTTIKIGCSGFPVGRDRYESKLGLVEITDFLDRFPSPKTIHKWRQETPGHFEFVVCANKAITYPTRARGSGAAKGQSSVHHKEGYFQDSAEVRRAYALTFQAAQTLASKIIYFQLPASLTPHADTLGLMQRFFRGIPRDGLRLIWDPPRSWPITLIHALSKSLELTPATNPLVKGAIHSGPVQYYRLGTPSKTVGVHRYSDQELKDIRRACTKPLSYVIFNNGPTAFYDAVRFAELVR